MYYILPADLCLFILVILPRQGPGCNKNINKEQRFYIIEEPIFVIVDACVLFI